MLLWKKESSSSVVYAPIAKAFHKLDSGTEAFQFEIAYFIANQNLKMGPLCELIERQGFSIGRELLGMTKHVLHRFCIL